MCWYMHLCLFVTVGLLALINICLHFGGCLLVCVCVCMSVSAGLSGLEHVSILVLKYLCLPLCR